MSSFFDNLFGSNAASEAAGQKIAGLKAAQGQADPLYEQGRTAINTGYGQAQDLFSPLVSGGQAGATAYGDITGANGPAGYASALQNFQTSPGYDFTRNAALEATQRGQGTAGFQNSGNVQTALQDRATQLANTEFGNYVSRLQPYLGYNLAGTAGAANQYTGQANALNANLGTQAGTDYQTQAGIGSAQAAGTLGDAASQAAGFNNILKIGGLALAPFTGGASLALTGLGAAGSGGQSFANQLLGFGGGGNVGASTYASGGVPYPVFG